MSLQGTLNTLGIAEVLEFLANRQATGQLDVTTEIGTALYLFSEGEVAQCEYSFTREAGADSAEATYYVMSELDGTFFFDEDVEPVDTNSTEQVAVVLSRTADVAEKWEQVEASIATPNHLLVRNTTLDSSVTIKPEWWRTLEVIAEGKTSMQVSSAVQLNLLATSMLLLEMTNAGLLRVEQIDPMTLEVPKLDVPAETEMAPDEPTEPAPFENADVAPAVVAQPTKSAVAETPEVAPIEDVAHTPAESAAPVVAPTPVIATPPVEFSPVAEEVVPAAIPAPIPEPPVLAPAPIAAFEPAAAPISEPPVSAPASIAAFEPAPAVEAPAPVTETAPVVPAAESFEPAFESAVEPVVELAVDPVVAEVQPAPVAPAPAPQAQAPAAAPAPLAQPDAPTAQQSVSPAPPVVSAPAPVPAPADNPDDGWASDHSPSYDVALSQPASPAPAQAAQPAAAPAANWELDGTFVSDEPGVAQPASDDNPFGALGGLLEDAESEEDRGNVLKFLRRD